MKILYTTPILEHPAAGGPQLRVQNSIIVLNRVSELHIISQVDKKTIGGRSSDKFFRKHCHRLVYLPLLTRSTGNRYIRMFRKISEKTLGTQIIKNEAEFIVAYALKNDIEVLWVGFGNITFPLIKEIKKIHPSFKIVCDTDSVWSRFILRELPYEKNGARRKQIEKEGLLKIREEKEWVNLCDVTTAVSQVEANYYERLAKDKKRIHIFSNAINLDNYKKTPPPPRSFKTPSFYLAGTFGHFHSPMDTAARWVINKVLPLVKKDIPEVHLYIVGKNSKMFFDDLEDKGITATGRLDSVLPYLCNTNVSIVPLKFESGTRFKILEAGACKVPIVSTKLGAEGIPVIDKVHILIADKPKDFAQAIIKLLNDKKLSSRLTRNCYKLVRAKYSIEALADEAKSVISYIKEKK